MDWNKWLSKNFYCNLISFFIFKFHFGDLWATKFYFFCLLYINTYTKKTKKQKRILREDIFAGQAKNCVKG